MDIHLTNVSGSPLERSSEGTAIDVDVTSDDSLVLSKGQDVEKGS